MLNHDFLTALRNSGEYCAACFQEVFKLTVMDTIFTLGQIVIIDVLRSIFIKYCNDICCWDLQKNFVR